MRKRRRPSPDPDASALARRIAIAAVVALFVAGLVVVVAAFAGGVRWLIESNRWNTEDRVTRAADTKTPITVVARRTESRPKRRSKPLIVRAEVQCDGEEAYRIALAEGLAEVLEDAGIGCNPDVAEPVLRLRVVGPEMMNIGSLRELNGRGAATLGGWVGFKAGLDVLDAQGHVVNPRPDWGPGNAVKSYVFVKVTFKSAFDDSRRNPAQYPAQVEEARRQLPEQVRSDFGNVIATNRRLLDYWKR